MLIALCGKSGSGKTTLANLLKEKNKNVVHLDIDKIGHEALLTEEVKQELFRIYGNLINNDGQIDRKRLAEIVFNKRKDMDILTKITWYYMEKKIDDFINQNKNKIIILDWILLTKTKYLDMCKVKILLNIPYEVRKNRVIRRDGISEFAFQLRDSNSPEYNPEDFDYVIHDEEEMKRKLVNLV